MAKTLEVVFKANTQQFTKGIGKMNSALIHLQNNVDKVNKSQNQAASVTNKIVDGINKKTDAENKFANATRNANNGLRKSGTLVDSIAQKLRMLASTYLGVMGAKALISTSDAMTGAENKLNYVNAQTMGNDLGYTTGASGERTFSNATLDATASTMEKIFRISQQARTGYTDMVSNVSKSMMLAGDAFGNNVDNAIRFQQIMSEAYTVGGASAAEQASSMYQMVQALGAGVLAGDELRSVREGAPLAYKAIEEFAQGVYDTTDSLKDMASEGMITSDIVVAGIMSAGDKMDEAFQSTTMTFGQMWQVMKSSATHSFMPVFDEMRKQMTTLTENGFFENFSKIMEGVAQVALVIIRAFGTALNFINDNWYWIKYIALGVLAAIGFAAAQSALSVMKSFMTLVGSASPFMKLAMLIGAVAAVLQLLANGSIDTAQVIIAAMMAVFLIWLGLHMKAIAFMLGLPGIIIAVVLAILAAIIAVVMLTSESIEDAVGKIVGGISVAGAFIANVVIGLVNAIIQAVTALVDPLLGVVEFIINAWKGGFDSFGDAVKNLLGNIISWFLQLGKVVTTIVDAIFGTDWTGGLSNLQSNLRSWGKNENAITLNREAPIIKRITYSDAYQGGYNWGSNTTSKIKDKISNLTNVTSSMDTSNLNLNTDSIDDITSGVGNLDDTTKKISDKMDTTIEDLQYLRDLAELEWKKEYTVASINVDMTNNNTVNGTNDLDGIVTKLSDMLYQELNEVAEGVYTM